MVASPMLPLESSPLGDGEGAILGAIIYCFLAVSVRGGIARADPSRRELAHRSRQA